MNSNSNEKNRNDRNNITDIMGLKSKSSSKKTHEKSKSKSKTRGDATPDGNKTPNIMDK
jgi:hypothetical protein